MKQDRTQYYAFLFLVAVIGLITGGVIVYSSTRSRATAPIVVSTPRPTETTPARDVEASLRVYVSGAVRTPAVYTLSSGSIVDDALRAAGGPTSDAALETINLALELQDQQHIHVPRQGEESTTLPLVDGASRTGSFELKVNINTATAAELESLPRVGPALAERIIAYREANGPFAGVDEIQNVAGIGPATLEELRDLITVGRE
ncbi:MAG: hypothetical protein GX620_14155 [Chloroflexi bacterium]|nr:hypothetical protein [Chloroflexota bacterium]